jgi:ribosomal protein S18 acetylase RimI-like enzyme
MIVRPALPEDAAALAHIHVAVWRSDYCGIVPDEYLAALSVDDRGDLLRDEEGRDYRAMIGDPEIITCVAEDPTAGIVGFSAGGPFRDDGYRLSGAFSGELYYVYVLSEYQGRGVGTDLVRAVARSLSDRGVGSMMVWVFANHRAASLYERLGAARVGRREVTLGGRRIIDVAYGWERIGSILEG